MATKKHSSQLIPLLLVLLALAIVVAVFAFNEVRTRQKNLYSYNQTVTSLSPTPTYPSIQSYFTPIAAPPIAPEANWQAYSNATLGISLKHPPDWFFHENTGPNGLNTFFSTPIDNPSSQNWRLGELAGGTIVSDKLAENQTVDSYIQKLRIEQPSAWSNSKQTGTLRIGNKQGLVLEGSEHGYISVFVENHGYVYLFDFGETYQSDKSNDKTYRSVFERVLSTVIFLN